MKKFILTISFVLLSILTVQAQNSADVTAIANVVQPLTVTQQSDLDFGTVIDGNSVTVLPENGGKVEVDGGQGTSISVDFTLPSTLQNINNGDTIPISFGNNSAGKSDTDDGAVTTFDPHSSSSHLLDNTDGIMYIYIGGTVNATSAPSTGTYKGTITVTANYN